MLKKINRIHEPLCLPFFPFNKFNSKRIGFVNMSNAGTFHAENYSFSVLMHGVVLMDLLMYV